MSQKKKKKKPTQKKQWLVQSVNMYIRFGN